ncbi:MAG TPA: hypothetical protein DEG32_16195, partial [Balneolaceae bacterium]|nr:hypothetical protein [Balneolaceae bacterium]
FRNTGEEIKGENNTYTVREFTHGLVMDDLNSDSEFETITDIVSSDRVPTKLQRTIPPLPPMENWVNIKDLGAVGDGKTDDTE